MSAAARARLLAYKIRPDELLDLIDGLACADASAILKRCPGGRLIRDGYMCTHCGQDPSARFLANGEPSYGREPGVKRFGRCGAPAKRVIASEDLLQMIPTLIE